LTTSLLNLYLLTVRLAKSQFYLFITIVLLLSGCATYQEESDYIIQKKLKQASQKHIEGDCKAAVLLYEDILSRNLPRNLKENVALELSGCYLSIENPTKAINILNELLNTSNNPYILGGVNFKLGSYYFENNDFIKAKEYLSAALKFPPKLYSSYLSLSLLAKAAYYSGDLQNAKLLFLKLAKEFPNDPYAKKITSMLDILNTGSPYLQLGKFTSLYNAKNFIKKLNLPEYLISLKEIEDNNSKFYLVIANCQTLQVCKQLKKELNRYELDAIEIP
jgi:tetratricopeptide (TPR) repeat protein